MDDPALPRLRSPFLDGEVQLLPVSDPAELEGESAYDRPKDYPKLLSDTALRQQLKRLKTRGARALEAALTAMAKPETFAKALNDALSLTPWTSEPGSSELQLVLARLGAEAFALDVQVPEERRLQLGFVNHPARLGDTPAPTQRAYFVHYACERLRLTSFSTLSAKDERSAMAKVLALLGWLARELGQPYPSTAIERTQLVAYQRLLVALAWKHYQAFLDDCLDQARRSVSLAQAAATSIVTLLASSKLLGQVDPKATLPTFNLDAKVFHDFFRPHASSDFAYSYFSAHAKPTTQKPFETSFGGLWRRRLDQASFLRELVDASGNELPPSLSRSESWQQWLVTMWNGAWSKLPLGDRVRKVLAFLQRYQQLFTLHVPHNLRESCKDPSYLVRRFPRASNGGRIHDCAVYAARWLHMLGGLFDPQNPAQDVSRPRLWLVEMPVHVGVMIRVDVDRKRELLVSINNAEAEVSTLGPSLTDEEAARRVVKDVYHDLPTPFVLHPLKASPRDAKTLWAELCRLFERRSILPYEAPSEPHLRYLEYKAELARLSSALSGEIYTAYTTLQAALGAPPSSPKPKPNPVEEFRRQVDAALLSAAQGYDRIRPWVQTLDDDLREHARLIPKRAALAPYSKHEEPPWWQSARAYKQLLTNAGPKPDISRWHPSAYFPEDDFIASIE